MSEIKFISNNNISRNLFDELVALEKKVVTEANFPLNKKQFKYHAKKNTILLYFIENQIAGYALILKHSKSIKIYSIAVLPEYRRRGIAKALLQMAINEAKNKKILLEVRIDNINAINLYYSFGFKKIRVLKSFFKDGCDAYLMKLEDKNNENNY